FYYLSDNRIMFFPLYCDYIYQIFKESFNLFFKILTNGIVNLKKIKSKHEFDILIINKLLKVSNSSEIRMLYEENLNNLDIKRKKEEERNYCYVDYEEVEKRIVQDYNACILIGKYNLIFGKIFKVIVKNKNIAITEIIKNIEGADELTVDIALDYLQFEGVIVRNKLENIFSTNKWVEKLKFSLLNEFVSENYGLYTRRIFNLLLKEDIYDSNVSKSFLLTNENIRKGLFDLQSLGFISILGDFSANTFYSKSNLKWKNNKDFALLFYANHLFKEIIYEKNRIEKNLVEFLIFSDKN
ncbi:hypothetical protein H311_02236, partial [Anncaliia algerae PRA109]